MKLLDVNVLVYAFRRDSEQHKICRPLILDLLNGDAAFAISEQVLSSVIRITTHPKIFREPSTLKEAVAFTESLRDNTNCRIVQSSDRHWALFIRLCESTGAKANLVTDAWFAALAIESGCTWITTDRDFSRFPGLTWQHAINHPNAIQNPA